jgi:transcriptional regulator of acetoin/glycerol metabolism
VLSATHHRLDRLVADGRFREDLYYRLNGYTLTLPPLRERSDVRVLIERLCEHWLDASSTEIADPAAGDVTRLFTPAALERLERHAWPGNIRQLEQALRALLALRVELRPITVDDLPADIRNGAETTAGPGHVSSAAVSGGPVTGKVATASDAVATSSRPLAAVELETLRRALHEHDGNVSAAARALGISRSAFYAKLRRSKPDRQ